MHTSRSSGSETSNDDDRSENRGKVADLREVHSEVGLHQQHHWALQWNRQRPGIRSLHGIPADAVRAFLIYDDVHAVVVGIGVVFSDAAAAAFQNAYIRYPSIDPVFALGMASEQEQKL